jgi:phenylacetate-CoA ligase
MSTECLTELVEFARRNSPYYRDLYAAVKAGGPHHLEDLPVIDQAGFWSANTPRNNGRQAGRRPGQPAQRRDRPAGRHQRLDRS